MENHQQDIDLFDVFKWLRSQFKKLLIYVYRFGRFLVQNAFLILGLIILGYAIGFGIEKLLKSTKSAEIIVAPNLESISYLYGKIDQINSGILSKNESLIAELNTVLPNLTIKEISVEPVEDITSLLENLKKFYIDLPVNISEELTPYTTESQIDKSSYFNKPLYSTAYSLHRITITATGGQPDPRLFIKDLENDVYLQTKRSRTIKSLNEELEANTFTINQIDSVLTNLNHSLKSGEQSLALLTNADDENLSSVLSSKTVLLNRNAKIQQNLIDLDATFKIYSSSKWLKKNSFKTRLKWILPLVFILFFIFYHGILKFRKRFKNDL